MRCHTDTPGNLPRKRRSTCQVSKLRRFSLCSCRYAFSCLSLCLSLSRLSVSLSLCVSLTLSHTLCRSVSPPLSVWLRLSPTVCLSTFVSRSISFCICLLLCHCLFLSLTVCLSPFSSCLSLSPSSLFLSSTSDFSARLTPSVFDCLSVSLRPSLSLDPAVGYRRYLKLRLPL